VQIMRCQEEEELESSVSKVFLALQVRRLSPPSPTHPHSRK
jgi:hypothetical protein